MKDITFAKVAVWVNCLVPFALLSWDALHHQLGANPIEFSIRTTGMLTLIFLLLTLAVTPLRKLTGYNQLSHFRRMLGLYAWFYGVAHFCIYFGFYQAFSVHGTIHDTIARPFILFGMTALLLITPLAMTSTNAIMKAMGGLQWKRLHSLIYVAAIAGVTHYWLLVKADTRKPRAFAVALTLLLGYRLLLKERQWRARTRNSVAAG